ncbi:Phosphoenolpyruvate-dependent sugar phosphotransferase system, EIIA 2 [compost metagenome]
MSLKEPVIFKDMVDEKNEIKVSAIFMLGLLKSEQQIDILQKLVDLFQDQEMLKKVIACTNIEEFKSIMKKANID